MQTEINEAEIKAKIAALRQSYMKLRAICGPQGINWETKEQYARQIEALQKQLN